MRWCDASQKNKSGLIAFALLVLGAFATVSPIAAAQQTEIGAVVCGSDAPGAAVSITQPSSDSLVEQSNITLRGSVNNAAQVEVFIDNSRDRTVAIGSGQRVFASDITVPIGTHTIRVLANDICGGQDAEDSVVITYEPIAQPSNGGIVPTDVGQEPVAPESVQSPEATDTANISFIEQFPLLGSAVSVASDFGAAIGLESTILANNTNVGVGVARVGVTIAALTSVALAGSLAPLAAANIPWVGDRFKLRSGAAMGRLGWIIRIIGIAGLGLAYVL